MYRLGSVEEHAESTHITTMDTTDLRKTFAKPYSFSTLDVPHNIPSAQQSAYSPLTMERLMLAYIREGFQLWAGTSSVLGYRLHLSAIAIPILDSLLALSIAERFDGRRVLHSSVSKMRSP